MANRIIGCGEWGFRAMPMREHFELAGKFGFGVLEFGIGGGREGRLPEEPDEADIEGFRALGAEFGIRTPFCCLENDFTLPDPGEHAAVVERVGRQMGAAAACGATHVRLFAGFTPVASIDAAAWRRMIEAFEVCDRRAGELGLRIAIETHGAIHPNPDGSVRHEHSVTTDRDALRRLVAELPPRVGFNYDPGNLKAVDWQDRRLALDLINERINYCHLKDWKREGDGVVAVAIGDDDLDYGPVFAEMRFEGVCLIEYEPLDDPEEGIQRSLDYLGRLEDEMFDLRFRQ